jgi:drug/metabolite transporter (DMT)-like permease
MKPMLVESSAAATPATAPRVDPRLILSLAAVYVIWSSTYLAIRIALVDLPPLLAASLRFVAAGLVLLAIAKRRGAAWPSAREWLAVAPIGGLLFLGGNGLVSIAQQSVSSGGAAVVCATMPLWMGVLGVISGERPTRREWLSLAVGFVGVFVLMGGPTLSGEPHHMALLMLSPVCWALGSVLARRLKGPSAKDSFMLPAMQMMVGGALLFAVAAMRGERIPTDASASSWLALGYLLVAGSLLGFTAYSWLLRNARPVIATSYAYVNPILAVLIGAVISGEPLGVTTAIANVLIVGAVWLALRRPRTTVTSH